MIGLLIIIGLIVALTAGMIPAIVTVIVILGILMTIGIIMGIWCLLEEVIWPIISAPFRKKEYQK